MEGYQLSLPQRALRGVATGGIALPLAALFFWTPESLLPATCTIRELTGLSCLTCGMTRSLHALVHGNIPDAVRYHLMGPILFAAALFLAGLWGAEAALGRRLPLPAAPVAGKIAAGAIALLWLGYWLVRMAGELA
jgi:hypothetical protein